jgi:hypothetical protein
VSKRRIIIGAIVIIWTTSFYLGAAAFAGVMCAEFCGAQYSDATPQSESRAAVVDMLVFFVAAPLAAAINIAMSNGSGFMWDWPQQIHVKTIPRDMLGGIRAVSRAIHFNPHQWKLKHD